MECLRRLTVQSGDKAHWQAMEKELADAYELTAELVRNAENSALDYNELRKKIRPMAVIALRKLDKKNNRH